MLMRDLEPVAVFDRYGFVRDANGSTNLLEVYRVCGSNLGAAVVAVLAESMR